MIIRILVLMCCIVTSAVSQEFTTAIEDNSFFIEEAYNQEENIIQHIVNGSAFHPGNVLETSFTEEWPVFSRTHQLSVTIPHFSSSDPSAQGIGDIMLNYRYQAIDVRGFAISPRISLIIPTGDNSKGFGNGTTGVQLNLPISKRLINEFVLHGNAGCTYLPDAAVGSSHVLITEYFFGGSVIYLTNQNFNVMLELLYTNSGSQVGRTYELIVNPGVRWAVNFGDLQIVPGIAFPFSFVSGKEMSGFFLYTSFEHYF
ncbi:MAG: transporter [Bacteroidetes bacterium]|nr:transporter [Bacteroidota bacterium]